MLGIFKAEFDGAHADGGVFQLTMHPHIIGHRSRMAMLSQLIDHMNATGDIWYATHADIARWCLEIAK